MDRRGCCFTVEYKNAVFGVSKTGAEVDLFPVEIKKEADGVLEFPSEVDGSSVRAILNSKWFVLEPGKKSATINKEDVKKIIIPSPVKKIGAEAFCDWNNLEKVEFGDNCLLETIGTEAFSRCLHLKEFDIPDGVSSVYEKVFQKCSALTRLHIGQNLQDIESIKNAVRCIRNTLEEITVSESNPSYCSENNCVMEKLSVPSADGKYMFDKNIVAGCKNSVIPEDDCIKGINSEAFWDIKFEKRFKIPENIRYIGDKAFASCKGLSETWLPQKIVSIGKSAFSGSDIKNVGLYAPFRSLGPNAFLGCNNLKTVIMEDCELTKVIPDFAFSGCFNLRHILLPPETAEIGANAFNRCRSLEKVFIPPTCSELGDAAFLACKNLKCVDLADSCVTKISSKTFCGCRNLRDVRVPDTVEKIDYSAFKECVSLSDFHFPKSLKRIDFRAFSGSGLTGHIRLPDNLSMVCGEAFEHCVFLKCIHLPAGGKGAYIMKDAFDGCKTPFAITVPASVENVDIGFVASFSGAEPVDILLNGDVHFLEYYKNDFNPDAPLVFHANAGASVFMVPYKSGKTGIEYEDFWDMAEERSKHLDIACSYMMVFDDDEKKSVDEELKKARKTIDEIEEILGDEEEEVR